MSAATAEREKYERAWSDPEYRHACHSLSLWHNRRDLFPERFASALDIGCGQGRLLAEWNAAGIDAWGVDIAENCLDPEVDEEWGHKVHLDCLWEMNLGRRFDFGICTDVMEHIPPEHVDETLERIAAHCDEVLFKIAHSPNQLGGEVLHLTLQPWEWWVERMRALGGVVEYLGYAVRSGHHDSLIRWTVGERACAGRRVIVVGSAPGLELPESLPGDVVIGANGGAAIAAAAGRRVDVLATTSYLFRDGADASEVATRESLEGLEFDSAWVDEKCGPATVVNGFGVDYWALRSVSPTARARFVVAACGSELWVSTGVWAVCLALVSGAAKVVTVGISGASRDHVSPDTRALEALERRGVEVRR